MFGVSTHGTRDLVFQWDSKQYKVTMSVHCHKSVPVLILPKTLLGHKTTTNCVSERLELVVVVLVAVQALWWLIDGSACTF